MIEYRFTLEDLARLRFAISPSFELAMSVRVLRDPAASGLHLEWIREARSRLRGLDLRPLLALLSLHDYTPDFLMPPPESPLATIENDLERIRETPAKAIRAEAALVFGRSRAPELQDFVAQPRRSVKRLADTLEDYWSRTLAGPWPRIRALLEADLAARARQLAQGGPEAALAELHPRVRWSGDRLRVNVPWNASCDLDGRGLQLVPSVFHWMGPQAIVDAPWQPTVVYPARGIGLLWDAGAPDHEALAAVIGRTRAQILSALGSPASTTRLAQRIDVTPGGVSQHLSALTAAGLVSRRREGREVLYLRTPLGDALLGI